MPEEVGNAGASGTGGASSTPASSGATGDTGTGGGATATTTPSTTDSAVASLERASAALESVPSTDKPAEGTVKPAGAATGTPNVGAAAKPGEQQFHLPQSKVEYDRIITNARNKAAADAMAPLAWAKDLKQEDVTGAVTLFREIQADPKAWALGLLEEMGIQPPAAPAEEELVDPDPDYTDPTGKEQFYSGKTVKQLLQNMEKRLTRQFQPALTAAEKQAQNDRMQAERESVQREATSTATEVMSILKQDPRFEANKAELASALKAVDPTVRKRIGTIATLFMCWNKVIAEKVLPNAERNAEKRLSDDLTRQAAVSVGSVVPGGGAPARKQVKDGDVDGLASRIGEIAATMGG